MMTTMKIFVAHSATSDYIQELYNPIKLSSLWRQHEFFLPHDDGKNVITKDIIEHSDLVIAEVSYPSTGVGIELGWANAAGSRIVALYHSGAKYSGSINFVTAELHEYSGEAGLISALSLILESSDG